MVDVNREKMERGTKKTMGLSKLEKTMKERGHKSKEEMRNIESMGWRQGQRKSL